MERINSLELPTYHPIPSFILTNSQTTPKEELNSKTVINEEIIDRRIKSISQKVRPKSLQLDNSSQQLPTELKKLEQKNENVAVSTKSSSQIIGKTNPEISKNISQKENSTIMQKIRLFERVRVYHLNKSNLIKSSLQTHNLI